MRALNRSSRSRFGQFVVKNLASKTDPWLSRISNGRVSWGMFNVPSATLKTTGAKSAEGYYGGFTDYREKTARSGRTIPVFRLTPRAGSGAP